MMPTLHNTERARAQTTTATTRTKTRGGDERARQSRLFPPFFKIASFSLSTSHYKINSNIYLFLLSPYLKKKKKSCFFFSFSYYVTHSKEVLFFYKSVAAHFFTVSDYCQFHVDRYFYFIFDQLKLVLLLLLLLFLCDSTFGVCVWKSPKFLMFPIIIRRLLPVLSEMKKERTC